ncbi:ATP-binding protein [Bacillus cereus]|nr:ATP-binding protein [Bacillus cereus]
MLEYVEKARSIRINSVRIEGFKAIKKIDISFPKTQFDSEADMVVIGSQNGIGKTSIMEACSLLVLSIVAHKETRDLSDFLRMQRDIDFIEVFKRNDCKDVQIVGEFEVLPYKGDKKKYTILLRINESDTTLEGPYKELQRYFVQNDEVEKQLKRDIPNKFNSLIGLISEPLIVPRFIYFHSYRKVTEGNVEFSAMMQEDSDRKPTSLRYRKSIISNFKADILKSMMSQVGLFDVLDSRDFDENIQVLNDLMSKFARGTIDKLRPTLNNSLDIRMKSLNDDEKGTFSFDGLSSGQKEIISTLYLVWRYTKNEPGIILIDEPELHLNTEWHKSFIRYLHKLAPFNQYIIATHSKEIFASVSEKNRLLLSKK